MPVAGSQCILCDLPVRYDTYEGCSHACRYCFANKKRDLKNIKKGEGTKALISFIQGNRNKECRAFDWNIPIHWGGLSDPFQPCEKFYRCSYEALKVFKETQYPFIVSTKGKLVADDEYLDLLSQCNCVVQISAVCSRYDVIEQGCPSFEERLEILTKVSARVQRTIVRVQPYMHEVFKDVYNNLEKFKEAGAYGVIIEGMKFQKKKNGLEKVGGDYCYPYDLIKHDFLKLKERAHQLGLKIYAGENRIRRLGDSLTCCGIDGLEGFVPNKYNFNHLLNGDKVTPTDNMKQCNTGYCFKSLYQDSLHDKFLNTHSYVDCMAKYYSEKEKTIKGILGVEK